MREQPATSKPADELESYIGSIITDEQLLSELWLHNKIDSTTKDFKEDDKSIVELK